MHNALRRRMIYLACAAGTMLLGLASRRYAAHLPALLGEYSGDTLWALMLFLLVSAVLVCHTPFHRAAISITLAFLVEFSQLYHAAWIDGLRHTVLGGLVLGFGFLWTDLVCYTVGIGLGAGADWLFSRTKSEV